MEPGPTGMRSRSASMGSLLRDSGVLPARVGAADAFSLAAVNRPLDGRPTSRAAMLFSKCARASAQVTSRTEQDECEPSGHDCESLDRNWSDHSFPPSLTRQPAAWR